MGNFLHMFLPLLVVFLMINVSFGDLSGPPKVGGWQSVNPKNETVQEMGKFAVKEYVKKMKNGDDGNLKYRDVLKAAMQVVNGIKYRLIIAAKNGTATNEYKAEVWDQPAKHMRNLTSFVPAKKEFY